MGKHGFNLQDALYVLSGISMVRYFLLINIINCYYYIIIILYMHVERVLYIRYYTRWFYFRYYSRPNWHANSKQSCVLSCSTGFQQMRNFGDEKITQYTVYKTGNKSYKLSNKLKGTILGSVYLFNSYITIWYDK